MKDLALRGKHKQKSVAVLQSQPIGRNNMNNINDNNNNKNLNSSNIINIQQCLGGLCISQRPKGKEVRLVESLAKLTLNDTKNNSIALEENEEVKVAKLNDGNDSVMVKEKGGAELKILQENGKEEHLNDRKSLKSNDDSELNKSKDDDDKFKSQDDDIFPKSKNQNNLEIPDKTILTKPIDDNNAKSRESGVPKDDEKSSDEAVCELSSRSPHRLKIKNDPRYIPYKEILWSHQSGGSMYFAEQPTLPSACTAGDSTSSEESLSFNIIQDELEPNDSPPMLIFSEEPASPECNDFANIDVVTSNIEDPNFCEQFIFTPIKSKLPEISLATNPVNSSPTNKFQPVAQPVTLDDCRSSNLSDNFLSMTNSSSLNVDCYNIQPLSDNFLSMTNSSSLNVDCYNIQPSPVPSPDYGHYHPSPVSSPEFVQNHPSPVSSDSNGSHQFSPINYQYIQHSPTHSDSSPVGSPQVVPTCTWRQQNSQPSNSSSSPSQHSFLSSPLSSPLENREENCFNDLQLDELNILPSPHYPDFEEPQQTIVPVPIDNYSNQHQVVNSAQYQTSNTVSSQAPLHLSQRLPPEIFFSQNNPCLPNVSMPKITVVQPQLQAPKPVVQQNTGSYIMPVTVFVRVQNPPPQKTLQPIRPKPPAPPAVTMSARERLISKLSEGKWRQRAKAKSSSFSEIQLIYGDEDGDTPLIILMCSVNDDIAMDISYLTYALVERMKNIPGALEARNKQGYTALYCASLHQPERPLLARYIAETLLELGVNIAEELYNGGNSLAHCVSYKGDTHSQVLAELLNLKDATGKLVFNLNRPNDHSGNS